MAFWFHLLHAAVHAASRGQTHGRSERYTPGQAIGCMSAAVVGLIAGIGLLWWLNNMPLNHSPPKAPRPSPLQGNSREQPAINAIWAAYGEVTLDENDPDKPVVAVSLKGPARRLLDSDPGLLKQFSKLRELQVCIMPDMDSRLEAVASLDTLQSLDLSGAPLTDGTLERLAALAKLQKLNLNDCQITDAGLKGVTAFPNLQFLGLKSAKITDAGLEHLKGLVNLQSLHLWGTQVTGSGLPYLNGAQRLDFLDLSGAPVTDAGLEGLAGLEALEDLNIGDTQITDAGLERLKKFQILHDLDVIHAKVTREGLDSLKKARPKLQILNEQLPPFKDAFQPPPRLEFKNPLESLFP